MPADGGRGQEVQHSVLQLTGFQQIAVAGIHEDYLYGAWRSRFSDNAVHHFEYIYGVEDGGADTLKVDT